MTKGGFELPSDYGRLAERVGFEPTVRSGAPDSALGKAASIRPPARCVLSSVWEDRNDSLLDGFI